jgi:putative transposase
VAVYQRRHHDGLIMPGYPELRLSPNEAYALAITHTGYVSCPRDPNTYFQLLPVEWRTIQHYGVEIDHLTYDAKVLDRYRRAESPYPGKHARQWPIRHDPRNRLHAYFHDAADGAWHVLRWTHAQDEHRPFTDLTLREAKRLLAARGRRPEDQDEVAAALWDLQNRTDAPESWTHVDRRRQARDAERARAAARDRQRAAAPVDPHAEGRSPVLQVVPDLPDSEVFSLDDLEDLGTWNPHASRQER